jgi:hypothetical protein
MGRVARSQCPAEAKNIQTVFRTRQTVSTWRCSGVRRRSVRRRRNVFRLLEFLIHPALLRQLRRRECADDNTPDEQHGVYHRACRMVLSLAKRVQVGGDVTAVFFRDTHLRHRRLRFDVVRVLQP